MSDQCKTRRGKYFSQRGVALIAVTVATSIIMVLVTEFSTNTNVDMTAARNNEAEMKTHFLARSGMNLSKLLIALQVELDELLARPPINMPRGSIQLADYVGLFMGAFGGSKEELEGMAAMLGGFAARDMKGLGVPEGSFDLQITTEDSKININCAYDKSQPNPNVPSRQDIIKLQLDALFYFDAYNPIFENEDAEGWRRDRDTQAAAFVDYVDMDRVKYQAPGASEDYGYENLRDRYEPKNNYLDTVGEIKLIRGVDDRFWSLFGSAFTVYGGCKLNLSAIDNASLIVNILFLAADPDKNDSAALRPEYLWAVAQLAIAMREFGFTFSELDDFATFAKDPKKPLEDLQGGQGASLSTFDPAQLGLESSQLAMIMQGSGVELDAGRLSQVAMVGARRTYRVESTAAFGKLSKRIVGVWDTEGSTNQNTRTPGNNEPRTGTWVFWRED
jgi:type II secretory pathway component PulK